LREAELPPSTDGQWSGATRFNINPTTIDDGFGITMPDTRGLFVLHAVLLHTGKILCFSGHVEVSMYAPLYYLFDPKTPGALLSPVAFPGRPDMFCCHYVQLADGRILAAGGSEHDMHDAAAPGGVAYQGSTGSKTIAIFDPVTESWTLSRTGGTTNELSQGRWYPTLVLLADGRVAVFSGRREHSFVPPPDPPNPFPPSIADEVEILSPPDYGSATLAGATKKLPIYPGLHLAKNGRIYFTHTCWGQEMPNPDTASILIPKGATSASWTEYPGKKPPDPRREEGMSVPLPAVQDGKILVIGGSRAMKSAALGGIGVFEGGLPRAADAFDHIENAADPRSANILDTNADPPNWSSAGTMAFGRINGHCVLLPDATVFVCGGHDNYKWLSAPATHPSLDAEIFKEGVGFRTVAKMTDPRMYHSVAMLLPDGRVFTAGGADANHDEPTLDPYPAGWNPERKYGLHMALNSKTFEFYKPPYMHNGPRPVLTDVTRNGTTTRRIEYGQSFVVTTPQAASIDKVVFMRPAACTHHTDTEQRYVRLEFTKGTNLLNVTAVNDANVAPPGYYMLWIVDAGGLPCQEALFVQLVPKVGQGGGGTTCAVATACLGSPLNPSVTYLQQLREEVGDSTATGRKFIATVNKIYGTFSPRLAAWLARNPIARDAVRDLAVRPVIAVVAACDRTAARVPRFRQPLLIGLFSAAAGAGVLAAPAIALTIAAEILIWRMRGHADAHSGPGSKE
jgi:hypothetical protein